MQYIFTPRRQGSEPQWISVSEISAKGMRIETQVPLSIRTAPVSPKGSSVVIKDKAGVVVTPTDVRSSWGGFHIFTLDPAGHEGPFSVEILAGVEK